MGAISQALLVRMVLDLTVWAAVVRPAWANWVSTWSCIWGVSNIRLARKHALTKFGLGDIPVLYLISIAI